MDEPMYDLSSALPNAKLVLVFGSVAKGVAEFESDLDLAVLLDHEIKPIEKLNLTESIGLITGRPVDLVDLRKVGQPLLNQILQENRRLVGSDEEYARLLMRNVCDQEDFAPMQRRLLKERRQRWIET